MTIRTIISCDGTECTQWRDRVEELELEFNIPGWLEFRPIGMTSSYMFCSYACLGGFVAEQLLRQQQAARKEST